jgi:hypothetical protein
MSHGLRIKIPTIASNIQKAISPSLISPAHTTPKLLEQLNLAYENKNHLKKESKKLGIKLFEPVEVVEECEKKPVVRFGSLIIVLIENRQSSHLR